jgi:hypothetical protein
VAMPPANGIIGTDDALRSLLRMHCVAGCVPKSNQRAHGSGHATGKSERHIRVPVRAEEFDTGEAPDACDADRVQATYRWSLMPKDDA